MVASRAHSDPLLKYKKLKPKSHPDCRFHLSGKLLMNAGGSFVIFY